MIDSILVRDTAALQPSCTYRTLDQDRPTNKDTFRRKLQYPRQHNRLHLLHIHARQSLHLGFRRT